MNKLRNFFNTTRVSIWLLMCILALTATSVYAEGQLRPLAAVDIIGSPDAAVTGKFAVGTATPGNKALTVAGVIDFVGAGTVHNYFTQGPGNNMQIRSNVDEHNAVGDTSKSQWNMVMGASLDVFSIRRSPASATYNEDALFWIEGDTGKVGIATVDTSNGATIPFTPQARLHVETASGDAIHGVSTDISGVTYGVWGRSESPSGRGVYGYNNAPSGYAYGVYGRSNSTDGKGVYGWATATSGTNYGVYGQSDSTSGYGVYGYASATSIGGTPIGVYGESASDSGLGVIGVATGDGPNGGVHGESDSAYGRGVNGYAGSTTGETYGVSGFNASTSGLGVYGYAFATSGTTYGVYGKSDSTDGYDFYAGGNGTNYGPFTGAHEVRLSDSFPAEFKAGMIVSATGEAQIRQAADGSVDLSSTLPTVKLADTPEDKAVLGVLVAEVTLMEDHWYAVGDGERFASVNALGEGRVWVTNINGGIKAGDGITTSEMPGYGQRQDDDMLHFYTLAKATETVDWDTVTETVVFNGQEFKVYLLAVVYTSG